MKHLLDNNWIQGVIITSNKNFDQGFVALDLSERKEMIHYHGDIFRIGDQYDLFI